MRVKNEIGKAQVLTIFGAVISIVSVFLPWFGAASETSSITVNGLFSVNGKGMLLGLVGGNANWEFQGIGVLALGIISIASVLVLKERLQGMAMLVCGVLIIAGGVVNLWSLRDISLFSGSIFGENVISGIGYGLYVVLIGGIITAAGGILLMRE